jgi:monolysocardiolipin acyltransferase
MSDRLAKGDWLHLFPEGRVSKNANELGRLKWGLGKMVCDVVERGGPNPTVLPFWHSGMEHVKKYGRWGFSFLNHVHVTVGEPVELADLAARCSRCDTEKKREKLYAAIAARVEAAMRETREKNLAERDET